MQAAQLETLEGLGRRLNFSVLAADIEKAVMVSLKKIARTAKISGFRPGKAPLNMIAQRYGHSAQEEAINELARRAFVEAVQEQKLRIAGQPRLEVIGNEENGDFSFSAHFEVFPDIGEIDLAGVDVEKPVLEVGEDEVEKTLDILCKQRTRYEDVSRKAKAKDRIIVDFTGTIEGQSFAGGSAQNYGFVIGDNKMLPEFEAAAKGLKTEEEKVFDLTFPEDYHGKDVAGKTAQFTIKVKNVAGPIVPKIDADFAISLGVADGDIEKMRQEIRQNIAREVRMRLRTQTIQNVTNALREAKPIDLPEALVNQEMNHVIQTTLDNLKAQGVDPSQAPFPPDMGARIKKEAENRVHLSLLMNELVRAHQLEPKPEQIKAIVAELAQSYEDPSEVEQWYYSNQERLAQVRQMALEDNVVACVLAAAKVTEKKMSFDSLMEMRG